MDLGIENENAQTVRMPHFGVDTLKNDIRLSRIQGLDQRSQINIQKIIRRQEPFNQILVNSGGQSAHMDSESIMDKNSRQLDQPEYPRKRAQS
jgi:hypothetical protein